MKGRLIFKTLEDMPSWPCELVGLRDLQMAISLKVTGGKLILEKGLVHDDLR